MPPCGIRCRKTGYTPHGNENQHRNAQIQGPAQHSYRRRCKMLCRNVHSSVLPSMLINSMTVLAIHSTVFATDIARMGLPWENLPTYASAKTVDKKARQRRKRHIWCAVRTLRQLKQRIARSHCQQQQRRDSIQHLDPLILPAKDLSIP